jgi:DNA polymerase III subunit alpha
MVDFVHLHLHSQYSLLDGAIHLKKLFPVLKERRMHSVALTDHGYMYGTLDFYLQAKKAGIKPILGCETYITSGAMEVKERRNANFHLILLARNYEGFQNLQYMVSMASLKGFYYKPRIDHELLKKYSKGLVGLSACLGGEIPRTFFARGYDAAKEMAIKYASYFEDGWFFLELQDNGLKEQDALNEALIKISQETGIPVVATNDCHYLNKEDARAQEILMAISQGKKLSDENRMVHTVDAFYIKTPEEMYRSFGTVPDALENTVKIAEACNVDIPNNVTRKENGEKPFYYLPKFNTPQNESQEDYVRSQTLKGLEKRFIQLESMGQGVTDKKPYFERMEMELGVVTSMDFSGYFLIVADFIEWARKQGIPVGPGRGSGAGSIVAYSLGITELDPIRYGLLFERFLNPERVSMPDFDIDFCKNRREEVMGYVRDTYGEDKVAQIATFSTLKSRAVIRDVGRVLGIELRIVDKVAKSIPMNASLDEAEEQEPKILEMINEDPLIADLWGTSKKLEGMYRHPGIHAAGVVISDKPIWEVVPTTRGKLDSKGESIMQIPLVSQYDKYIVEEASLVKFDFLGLDNLTKIEDAEKRINRERKKNGEDPFDISLIRLDDAEVFKMVARGETGGVFQMESEGFAKLLQQLKPNRFEDMIAAVALYRPGPLQGGMVAQFVKFKNSGEEIIYPHPLLEEVLDETYGVFVYQEQVMLASRVLAGFSLGKADELRKAMGKKLMAKMELLKNDFMEGCAKNDIEEEKADEIFDYMLKFAEYGFNKSHSAAYGLISYQTAYLRYHHPIEFMAGILSCEKNKPDKIMKYLQVARQMNIKVLLPDINQSFEDFTIIKNDKGQKEIRFGLGAIKGVGESAVEAIIQARGNTSFVDLFDICKRVDLRRFNKGVLEAVIRSGALDNLIDAPPEASRITHISAIELALSVGSTFQKDKASNQISLFDMFDADVKIDKNPPLPVVDPWPKQLMFKEERNVLGIYLSGHPLESYLLNNNDKKTEWNYTVGELSEWDPTRAIENEREYVKDITTIGIVTFIKERRTRERKELYAQGEIDGLDGQIGFFAGSKVYSNIAETLTSNEPLLIYGALEVSAKDGAVSKTLRINDVGRVGESRKRGVTSLKILVSKGDLPKFLKRKKWCDKISKVIADNPGEVTLSFLIRDENKWETLIAIPGRVKLNDHVVGFVEQNFGEPNIAYLKGRPRL